MAIQFTDFSKAPLTESPWKNALENVLKGYKMGQEPARMKQEAEERALSSQFKRAQLEHLPKQYELDDKQKELVNSMKQKANAHYEDRYDLNRRVKEAQLKKAEQTPESKFVVAQAINLRDKLDPSKPNYQHDFDALQRIIETGGAKATGKAAAEVAKPTEITLPDGSKGYVQAEGNNKKDWQPVKNVEGKITGYNVPMTEKMSEQWKGTQKFNVVQPFLNDALSYYSGSDSWERYTKDVAHYQDDAAARDRIDNFNAAEKLLTVGALTENERFRGHNTNVQLNALKKTLEASEVYQKLKTGATVKLPQGYTREAGKIYKTYLDKFEDIEKKNIPSHEYHALNPGKNNYQIEAPTTPTDIQTPQQYEAWFDSLTSAQKYAIAAKSKANRPLLQESNNGL